MIDINKIGQEVAALIRGAEKDKEKIAPMLREVWAALDEKKEVNGVTTKSAWAKPSFCGDYIPKRTVYTEEEEGRRKYAECRTQICDAGKGSIS